MIFKLKEEPCPSCQALREEHKIALGNLKEQHYQHVESIKAQSNSALELLKQHYDIMMDSLREQIAATRTEKDLLLHTMLEERKPKEIPVPIISDEPVVIKNKTWASKRAELEAQSREEAIRLAKLKREEDIARVERETGLSGNKDDLSVRMTSSAIE